MSELETIGPDDYDADAVSPGADNVLQEVYEGPAVAVRQVGPVTVHELPTRVATSRSINVTDVIQSDPGSAAEQIATYDPRRKSITILAATQPIYVGHSKQDVVNGTAGVLPAGIPLTLNTSAEVWVRCSAAGQTAVVSYWSQLWAD